MRRGVMRLMAMFMAALLLGTPQIVGAMMMMQDELDPSPLPIVEEEIKHVDTIPLILSGHVPSGAGASERPPVQGDDLPTRGDLGEVPHPPPWA